jgi:RHS repeat-associated protein
MSANNTLPTLVTEPLRQTAYAYFSGTNLVQTKTITDPATHTSRTWSYTYDSYGRVLTAKGPRTDVNSTTTYTYYTCTTGVQCGQLDTVTDAVGHVTTYTSYNAHGQPLSITDANGVITTLTYDARQRLTSREVGTETTTFSYWPTGRLKQVTLPDSSFVLYAYDAAQRLVQISDQLGNKIVYTLDAMGNRTAENDYDPSGVLHKTHSRVINVLDRLYQDVNAAGTSAVTTTYGYDNDGNQTSVAAPLSRDTENTYDPLSRLAQVADPANGVTRFGYDLNDALTSVVDPRTLTTGYQRNGFGDVLVLTSPDTGTTTNAYDSAGNLATSTDARGTTATYAYDALNRPSTITYSDGGVADQTITLTYDAGTNGKGHLTGASDANHTLSWAYDGLGRVITKAQTVGTVTLTTGYAYTNSDLTTVTTPSGQTITYGYNTNHQIASVMLNGTAIVKNATYEPFGSVNGWTWGNGTAATRTFDTDGYISQIASAGTKTYAFDAASRITGITDATNSALSWTFGYDPLDRVNSAATTTDTQGFTYDANGNRLTETGTTAATFNVATGSNRLSSTTGALTRTYSYDSAGHTLSYASLSLSYDDAGRLVSALNGSTSTTYKYDALGERVLKTSGSTTTYFAYDLSGHLLGEYSGTGALIQEIVWMGDTPVASVRPTPCGLGSFYIHTDHLNTPRRISRQTTADIVWRWDSDPFGDTAPNQNPSGLGTFSFNLRFPGQYYDAETGLNQNWNRDYDPVVSRYIESDPIGLRGGSYSTYSYASANPVMVFDPSGLLVQVIGHVAASPLGKITSPTSYHSALFLKPDDPCHCSGTWPVTLGAQDIGGTLVGSPNYPGDASSNAQFRQVVRPPAGMSDCDFIRSLISAAASYGSNIPYSFPSIPSGAMAPGQYNSNSFVSGVLQAVGATPPSINTGGQFQLPGYQNPIPLPSQR